MEKRNSTLGSTAVYLEYYFQFGIYSTAIRTEEQSLGCDRHNSHTCHPYMGDDCYLSVCAMDYLYAGTLSHLGLHRDSSTIFYHLPQ
jgi:hypothetical protein